MARRDPSMSAFLTPGSVTLLARRRSGLLVVVLFTDAPLRRRCVDEVLPRLDVWVDGSAVEDVAGVLGEGPVRAHLSWDGAVDDCVAALQHTDRPAAAHVDNGGTHRIGADGVALRNDVRSRLRPPPTG